MTATATPLDPQPLRVLYVEDQEINILVMQALVAMRPGVELRIAMNGEEGLRVASDGGFHLLLLDLRLPDCHGTDLLSRLRALPALADVPAVAVTADVSTDIAGSGFVELWPKPLHVPDTLRALDRLLNGPPGATVGRVSSTAGPESDSDFGRFAGANSLRRSIARGATMSMARVA